MTTGTELVVTQIVDQNDEKIGFHIGVRYAAPF
jgi:hypothetical protein